MNSNQREDTMVVFQVIATTPMGRTAFDMKVTHRSEAVRAAKFFNRSGYTTVINELRETSSNNYHLVKSGRPRAPRSH